MDLKKEFQIADNLISQEKRVKAHIKIAQKYAEHYHNLQLQQAGVMARCNIDLAGKELEYISPITKATTKFKVADVFVNIFNVGLKERQVYGEVFAISENGNKYKIDEFSEVRIPQ